MLPGRAGRRPDATEGAEAPSVRSLLETRRTDCVGGTSSHPSWRRRSGWIPPGSPAVKADVAASAAAHLQGPVLIMHRVGPPPFPGTETCTTGGGQRGGISAGPDRTSSEPASGPARRRRADRADGAQVARAACRSRRRPARGGRPRPSPRTARGCSRRSPNPPITTGPAGYAVEPFDDTPLRLKNSTWNSRMRRTSSGVSVAATSSGTCSTTHAERVVEVVQRGRRFLGDPRGLAGHEERGDADDHPHHEEPDDDRHRRNVRTRGPRPGTSGRARRSGTDDRSRLPGRDAAAVEPAAARRSWAVPASPKHITAASGTGPSTTWWRWSPSPAWSARPARSSAADSARSPTASARAGRGRRHRRAAHLAR